MEKLLQLIRRIRFFRKSSWDFYRMMTECEKFNFRCEFEKQRNSYELFNYLHKRKFYSFDSFINQAFIIGTSDRGAKYWNDLIDKYTLCSKRK
jgi:hypothetical protein